MAHIYSMQMGLYIVRICPSNLKEFSFSNKSATVWFLQTVQSKAIILAESLAHFLYNANSLNYIGDILQCAKMCDFVVFLGVTSLS